MTIADWVMRFLAVQGVTHVFHVPGGMITPLLDAAHRNRAPRLVGMHHEQAAGFAAEGWARMQGIPGVAMATSGPGATNLLTAIASCYFDSTPAVFIAGQVPTREQRGGRKVRQLGFQELDIVTMAAPVTKAAISIHTPSEVPDALALAFWVAAGGRPGPVLIDLPFDVQQAETSAEVPTRPVGVRTALPVAPLGLAAATLALASAARPLILVGGGCASPARREVVRRALARLGAPVVYSLMGVDVLPAGHPLRVGLIGSYGNRYANLALAECDALLVLGSRLDVRQTGHDLTLFEAKRIVQVDLDSHETQRVPVHHVEADVGDFCAGLLGTPPDGCSGPDTWHEQIRSWKAACPAGRESQRQGTNPNHYLKALGAVQPSSSAFVVDVGQVQMWAAQSLEPGVGQRFLTSGGHGAMGFALPAAIGACLASGQPVTCIAGDGGFQMNLQELQTVVREQLPVRIIVMNNRSLGMVRQFQDAIFGGRHVGTVVGYSAPDFEAVAEAYGLGVSGGCLIEVPISPLADALPKLAFGGRLDSMDPPLDMEVGDD